MRVATANPVQLGPSPSGSVRGAGPTFLKLGYYFSSTRPTIAAGVAVGTLEFCVQFSIYEMNRWRGRSESHSIRVTLSFGKACVHILRPFTPCLSKF